jgi:uncharacterized membrane protein YphA (DoxX/SURF4 family)
VSALIRLFGHPAVVRSAQVAVGILLAWAALAKLGDIPALARDIHGFRLLPGAGDNLVAIVLPWVELTAAASLVLGLRPRAGAFAAVGLLFLFTTAVALAVVRGLNIECGCFGTAGAMRTGGAKLAENLGMLALAALAAMKPVPRETTAASREELRT